MKTNKDAHIEKLLQLFMDGQTSVKQENELAEYFASHDVPEQWSDYKAMFGFIAEGMPGDNLQEQIPEKKTKQTTWRMAPIRWAAAAAAIVTAMILWNGHETPVSPDILTAAVKDTVKIETKTVTDSMPSPVPEKRGRMLLRQYRHIMSPPKVYLARTAATEELICDNDSIQPIAPEIDREVERRLHEIEMAQQNLLNEHEIAQMTNDIILSLMEEDMEEDKEEIIDIY